MLQAPEPRFLCRQWRDHGGAAVWLQPAGMHGEAEIRLHAVEEPCTRAAGCLQEAVMLWETCGEKGSVLYLMLFDECFLLVLNS